MSVRAGLEDVVVADSTICFVDGQEGRLLYRGYDIHDLVRHSSFEEVAYLLWYGRLPARAELEHLRVRLRSSRDLPEAVHALLRAAPAGARPMEVLRTAVSALSMFDPDAEATGEEAWRRCAVRLTARMPAIVAAFHRLRRGLQPVLPRPDLDHAANLLYMLRGEEPDSESARILDRVLILHADHEFNASTFAARVTAATLSDVYSAVTSAIAALKGPLHGGANERVMAMLQEIGSPERAEAWVKDALARKERIMGFGHRVYRTMDPRAVHLKEMARQLGERAGDTRWFEIQEVIERVMREEKGLYPNVDFYAATVYHHLGIETDLFTPMFAISRITGWTAHIMEQYAHNRLIRPRSHYVGPLRETYVPLERRAAG